MSKSYKRNSWSGWTNAPSDKEWKRHGNRTFRRKGHMLDEEGQEGLFDIRQVSDAWDAPKDGKAHLDPKRFSESKRQKWFDRKGRMRK